MTIGLDGSRAFSGLRTGAENYSYQLLKALAKIDHVNNYLVYLRFGSSVGKWPANFKFITLNWRRFWTQGGLALQTFKDDLDVLFVPAHTLPILRKPNLKTVMTVHDLGVEYLPQFHQLKQEIYLKYITKYQLKSATKLIAVSKATKEDLVKRAGINLKKINVVYEGFDKELFKPTKADRLVNSLMPYYLFVGTIQPRKNLLRIITAFSKLGEGNLVIAGLRGWLSDDIYALPRKLGIEDKVKFLGYVPDEKLPALYCGAQALLFCSLFEGFGLPILEAQSVGCPVITSNVSSMPEVAGKGAIYVDPYSIQSIADGMIKIMNRDLRLKLKDLGFKNIKRFSWEKCAKETLEILENI